MTPRARPSAPPVVPKVDQRSSTPDCPRDDHAHLQRLQLECDETLSSCAFKLNLRRYAAGRRAACGGTATARAGS